MTGAENWNSRCLESIRKEKMEVEARYGIRTKQTEIYCSRCGKSWGFGRHTCQDVRLKSLNEVKKIRTPIPRANPGRKCLQRRVDTLPGHCTGCLEGYGRGK